MKTLLRLAAALLLPFFAKAEERRLWLAVGSADFLQALEPLAELRRSQGLETLLLPLPPEEALKKAARRPDFLLIVGDEDPAAETAPWRVAAPRRPFHRWNQKQRADFASDWALGGLDDDGYPLIAVGRLPVRSVEETQRVVGKILEWEKRKPSRADLTMPMWAGDPAYDPKFTAMFMAFFFAQVQKHAPAWLEPWVMSGDLTHPLAGWPAAQARMFDERTGRGALLAGMMGHGAEDFFCSIYRNKKWEGYANANAEALKAGPVRPPQMIFACDCGWFDLADGKRSLAEQLLLVPAGPVLTIAASNESHPLPNFYTATNLLRLLAASDGAVSFGELWLRAQQELRRRTDGVLEMLLKGVEGNYGAATDPRVLKRDQATLYALFGDPATRLHAPRALVVKVEKTVRGWSWEVTPPPGAAGKLEVEHRVAEPAFAPRPADTGEAASLDLFAQANAALAFRPVAASGWRGETDQAGILRFIVETPAGLWVAGAVLK